MTEYSRMAKGHYTVSGGSIGVSAPNAKVINLPFQPDYVEFINYTEASAGTDDAVPFAWWDKDMGQGFAVIQRSSGSGAMVSDVVEANGISSFSAGLALQFGARQQVVGATAANPIVFNVTAHGYSSGDVVMFQGLYQTQFTAGMPQIDGMMFTITVTDADHFSIPWNGNQSNYTALSASPTGAYVKKVLYPYLYFPGVAIISAITLNTPTGYTTVDTTSAHNFVVGQEVAFRIPPNWGTIELNSLPNNVVPGSPIYGYVVSVTDYNTFVVNIDSSSYTAFNSNQTVASVPGGDFPQVVAVGDVNTGGVQLSAGSQLYPPPQYRPIGNVLVNTINGPAIQGAFVNNTRQGFVIGVGFAKGDTTAFLGGAANDVIYWRAFSHDMNVV